LSRVDLFLLVVPDRLGSYHHDCGNYRNDSVLKSYFLDEGVVSLRPLRYRKSRNGKQSPKIPAEVGA
jgi:hypothetical protein